MITTITQALQRGDIPAALSAAQAFAIREAQNPQAQHWLGICLQRSGDIAGARTAIDQAINLAPDRADFQISRAALALGEKEYAAAEQGMKNAVNLDPNQLQAYVTLAHMALARGENDEASKQLKLAQRVNPDHPHVLLLEGHVAQYSGQADHALKCFTAAAELDSKNPLTQISLGMAYGARGLFPFAEQAFTNAFAMEPNNPGVLRGLVRSQMAQEKWLEAIDTISQWLANKPDDYSARMMRAQVRAQIGQVEEMLEDLQYVKAANPGNPQVLSPLVNTLAATGRANEALEEIESALSSNSQSNGLWSMRATMTSSQLEATKDVIERWLAAMPESAQAHEALAQMLEKTGQLDAAEVNADIALAIQPNLPYAQLIKLRAEIRSQPKAALQRLDVLEKAATNAESQRMVFAWRGVTHDKLKQYDKAAESFQQMAARPLDIHRLPQILPAHENHAAEVHGTLLWAMTGARMELVLQTLSQILGPRLLAERNLPTARQDGFGHQRGLPGTPQAGTAQSWQSAIAQVGIEPNTVVDWIPHFDAYTASQLHGARTLAIVIDPRDALINWLVYGSSQAYMFHPDINLSAEWLAQTCEAFAEHLEKNPEFASMVKIDALSERAESIAQALQTALQLPETPDAKILGMKLQATGGFDNEFPAGHWRHYRDSYPAAFARLTPVAVRLGYSEL